MNCNSATNNDAVTNDAGPNDAGANDATAVAETNFVLFFIVNAGKKP
jgi:hypothetical protein